MRNSEPALRTLPSSRLRDAEAAGDRAHVLVLALERERRGARDDLELGVVREVIDQLLRQAIREILLIVLLAHVDERQHRDRFARSPVRRRWPALHLRSARPPPCCADLRRCSAGWRAELREPEFVGDEIRQCHRKQRDDREVAGAGRSGARWNGAGQLRRRVSDPAASPRRPTRTASPRAGPAALVPPPAALSKPAAPADGGTSRKPRAPGRRSRCTAPRRARHSVA